MKFTLITIYVLILRQNEDVYTTILAVFEHWIRVIRLHS